MIVPENKLCPMGFNNTLFNRNACPCLGEMCMWFDKDNGVCLGARPMADVPVVEPVTVTTTTATTKTRATSRKKDATTAQ